MNTMKRIKNSKNVVMILLIINVGIFFLMGFTNLAIFALIPSLISQGWVFQLFTYMFLHGSFLHLLVNMYALLIFGTVIEQEWGTKKFLIYYFVTGIGAGICIFIMNFFIHPEFMNIPTIGASGAVFGILLAFGILFPDNIILLFFVLPIKAKYMVILYGGLELYFLFSQPHSGISHIGHVGGLLVGILYFVFVEKKSRKASKKIRAKAISAIAKQITKQASANEAKRADINKLNEILNKFELDGTDSLSKSDYQLINYYNKTNNKDDDIMCDSLDFNNSDSYCLKCESYIQCILRKINSIINYNDNSKNNT